ncbi:SDR family NAD(P)-dependent oxidoreductase [Lysinibacillus sp. NPDC058147]|uniref:SDR family NAD(P)-dependent oxidoreductase n=1 Tax=unclassified Lysinibacillus TaxID=2636778 RepID=UPI0036DCB2AD
MDKLLEFIINDTKDGKIDKESAIHLVKLLKQSDIKENQHIAIIGISGKMPLANDVEEYWSNISNGLDCVSPMTKSREQDLVDYLRFTNTPEEQIKFCEYGFMEEIDKFDYSFFRLSYKEAGLMDPNQRMFLETAWHAIEDAGYGGNKLKGSNTGVYVGFASSLRDLYLKQVYDVDPTYIPLSMVGNLSAVLPSRISYLLDLKGPSMLIDTACSSSLVAIATACDAIRNQKCDLAVAGGIKINLLPLENELFQVGIESSDSRTRAFNHISDGSGIGEGVAAVVLKPLKQALKDGDNIYGVIKGYATNQDGNSVGITAPNPAAQSDVLVSAWEDSGVDPETITYIETHGTGTPLGDPIEVKGITNAFKQFTEKPQFCAISSVKSNVGHSSEAAGILSVLKGVMALKHKMLPPSLFFSYPNQSIKFSDSAVYVNSRMRKWEVEDHPRRCGVSSFGISGTNCHIVLEEAPNIQIEERFIPSYDVLALSAGHENGLKSLIQQYVELLEQDSLINPWDVSFTANTGRGHYNHRLAVVYKNRDDLLRQLKDACNKDLKSNKYYSYFKVVSSHKLNREKNDFELTEEERIGLDKKATKVIESILSTDFTNGDAFYRLCNLYKAGANIDWDSLYRNVKRLKVSLPGYPFERTRCWIDIPQTEENILELEEDKYYSIVWNNEEIDNHYESSNEGTILIFKDKKGYWSKFSSAFKENGNRVCYIDFGESFERVNEDNFIISGNEKDYESLIELLQEKNLTRIIHLSSIYGEEEVYTLDDLKNNQNHGVYSMFFLVKALVKGGLDQSININVISEYVAEVTGKENKIYPENAPLFGIGKTINQEHPTIKIKCMDIDNQVEVESLMAEMGVQDEIYQVAFRNGRRYVEEFKEIQMDDLEDRPVEIKDQGVYLITGGSGGIGLEMAEWLASQRPVRIALIGRTLLPERTEWDQLLEQGDSHRVSRMINRIKKIEEMGSHVHYFSADISNEKAVRSIINELKQKYGNIQGVIHAAGVPGDGFLFKKDLDVFDTVLFPKVYGTWVIHHVTKDENLDFFVMFSSGQSILSEPGHGDYTAANAYLDSFSSYRKKLGLKTLTINWTTWKETGMAVNYGFNYDALFKAITIDYALEGFQEVLNKNINRVLIGEFSYNPQFLYMLNRLPFKLSSKLREKSQKVLDSHSNDEKTKRQNKSARKVDKVELSGREDKEFSEIEVKVATIYNEVLGYTEIDIHDSFFELGGDSVMLNRMHAILEQEFPNAIKLIDLFNYTTIASLSKFIAEKTGVSIQEEGNDDMDELNKMLDDLSAGDLSIDAAIEKINL